MNKRLTIGLSVCCMGLAGFALSAGEALVSAPAAVTKASAAAATTLDNLRTALQGETNAVMRYQAFAVKAETEGYKGVAVLLRAAAASEAIHVRKHVQAITKLGGVLPVAVALAPEVKSTRENLESILSGEIAAKAATYADFAKQAALDKNQAAVYSFKGALAASQEHAKFIRQALAGLDAWKAEGRVFAVCTVCGFTVMGKPPASCPICQAPAEKFEVIK